MGFLYVKATPFSLELFDTIVSSVDSLSLNASLANTTYKVDDQIALNQLLSDWGVSFSDGMIVGGSRWDYGTVRVRRDGGGGLDGGGGGAVVVVDPLSSNHSLTMLPHDFFLRYTDIAHTDNTAITCCRCMVVVVCCWWFCC